MGFRFSRRVSILPGLKLNLSGSGVSLSAGVRGAHINLGPRGLYGSAGIPGTGLSYRQRLDSSSRSYDRPSVERRLSTRQWGALQRRQEQEEKAKEAQQGIDDQWEQYQQMLHFWKPLPEIPSMENFLQAQTQRPFESTHQPPPEPVWPEEQIKCLNNLAESVKSQAPYRLLPALFAQTHAKTLFPAVWQERQPEIQQRYQESLADYKQQLKAAQAEWAARETERIACLQRLAGTPPMGQRLDQKDGDDPKPWLEAYAAGVGSPLELKFLKLFQAHGFNPEKQMDVSPEVGQPAISVADFGVRETQLAIYIDGAAFHTGKNGCRNRFIRSRLENGAPPWKVVVLTAIDLKRGDELVKMLKSVEASLPHG
jgi:hypothetical protein